MMLSACDHPRAGLLPNDLASRPPSAPSMSNALIQGIRLKVNEMFFINLICTFYNPIRFNFEIQLNLAKRIVAHIRGR